MLASVSEKPHVTLHRRVPMGTLLALRQTQLVHGKPASVTVMVAWAVAQVLRSHDRLNGRVEGGETRVYRQVNLGVAVDIDGGLVVPVVRDADLYSPAALGERLALLAQKARTRSLSLEDAVEATFTITNLGAFGIEFFTPIINPPQLAILGLGAVVDMPVHEDGAVVLRPAMGLSLSFDHCASDGADGARFLDAIASGLVDPQSLLDGQPRGSE